VQHASVHQRCAWTGLWIFGSELRQHPTGSEVRLSFLHPDPGWSWISFGVGFHYWKKLIGCLLDLYLPGLKQESDLLNLVGTGSQLDSDSQFEKQDWFQTQTNQSPNTCGAHITSQKAIYSWFCTRGVQDPVIALLESMTLLDLNKVTIFGDSDWTRVTLRKMVTRLDTSHIFHGMTRLKSGSFLQNLRDSDQQTQFVCIERNDQFLVHNDQNWCKFSILIFKSCYTLS